MRKISNLYCYKPGSQGAKVLSEALGVKRISHQKSRYRGDKRKTVLNWGSSTVPVEVEKSNIINHPDVVSVCTNKLKFFRAAKENGSDLYLPQWTEDMKEALEWIKDGKSVVCRTVLTGHSGDGIVLASTPEELVKAPLYTLYIKKAREFRLHIFQRFNERNRKEWVIVDAQEKKKRLDAKDVNWQIRSHANGFVYCREGLEEKQDREEHIQVRQNLPAMVSTIARSVAKNFKIDFGAIDVIWNQHEKRAYVLEINTAPGLEGQTLERYKNEFLTQQGVYF